MAMVKCPHCGKNVSDKDRRCPNCDFEINRNELVCSNCGSVDLIDNTENALSPKNKNKGCLFAFLFTILSIITAPFLGRGIGDGLISAASEGTVESLKADPKKAKKQLEEEGKAIYLCRNCKNQFIDFKEKGINKK